MAERARKSGGVGLIVSVISFPDFQTLYVLLITSQTDGRTDRRHSNLNNALCTLHPAIIIESRIPDIQKM